MNIGYLTALVLLTAGVALSAPPRSPAAVPAGADTLTDVPADRRPAILLGPRTLDPVQHRVGQRIPDLTLAGIDGRVQRLSSTANGLGTVVVVRDPTCPVSRRYGPRIQRLAALYDRDYRFVFIYPSLDLTSAQRREDAQTIGRNALFVERGSFALAESLGVTSTGDVFVLDAQQRLRFRGAIDDQYGIGYTRDFPTTHYLRNALDDLHRGRPIQVPATSAPGCHIDADPDLDQRLPAMPGGHLLSMAPTRTKQG